MADHNIPPPNPDSPPPLLPPPPPAADAATTSTAAPSHHSPPLQPYPQFFICPLPTSPPPPTTTSTTTTSSSSSPSLPMAPPLPPSWVFPPAAAPQTPSPMPLQGPSLSPPPPNPKQDPSPKSPSLAVPSKRKRSGKNARRRVDMSGLFPPLPAPSPVPPPAPKPSLDESEEIIVINKESTGEAVVGLSAGFPADSLTEEEIDANVVSIVGGIEQVNYILIRNHIIARWLDNVSHCLAKEPFLSTVPPHCHYLLDSAYSFLVTHG